MKVDNTDSLKTLSEQLNIIKNTLDALMETENDTFVEVDKKTDNVELLTVENWFLAMRCEEIDVIKVFIENKFDINVKNNGGDTLLIMASSGNHIDITKLLIDAGADMDIKGNGGCTALMLATQFSKYDIVKLLLKAGVDINVQDEDCNTAIERTRPDSRMINLFNPDTTDLFDRIKKIGIK